MTHPHGPLGQWTHRLRAWSRAGSGGDGLSGAFGHSLFEGDELGHLRDVDLWFARWVQHRDGGLAAPPGGTGSVGGRSPPSRPTGVDCRLWAAAVDPSVDVGAIVDGPGPGGAGLGPRSATDAGALVPQGLCKTLEVWTETELAALHALRRLATIRHEPRWRDRALACARWHVENLQPDNATNRPWAVHLFVELGVLGGVPESELYAQTLLHNCVVSLGRPDRLSAAILLDAALALEDLAC